MDIVTGVGVLDKAMSVIRAVADAPRSLVELQAETRLPRATAHRLATALEAHGMLRRDADGRFDLGQGLVPLGRTAAERFSLVEVARPVLEQVRDETGESVQLFVREGDQRRCVLSLESTHGLRWIVPQVPSFRSTSVRPAGCCPARSAATDGSRASANARRVSRRSARRSSAADGSVVAALSVSGPIERLTRQPGKRFGADVVAAARRILP